MAKEEQKNSEAAAEKEKTEEKAGNFLNKYGKIFLIAAILLVQAGAAYAVINSYYDEIYEWFGKFSTEGHVYYTFDNIIINPAHSDGERYLILSIVVELNSGSAKGMLDTQNAKITDKINLILTHRTVSELSDLSKRDEIKQEIGIMINGIIGKKAVRNLFFTKYVLQ
ncbi:MAG: flagellar basal body-associated FliL family protein [Balneolaceae bacterium]|jgi:flagellar FliL protein